MSGPMLALLPTVAFPGEAPCCHRFLWGGCRLVPLFGLDGYSILYGPLNNSLIISNSSDRCFWYLTLDVVYLLEQIVNHSSYASAWQNIDLNIQNIVCPSAACGTCWVYCLIGKKAVCSLFWHIPLQEPRVAEDITAVNQWDKTLRGFFFWHVSYYSLVLFSSSNNSFSLSENLSVSLRLLIWGSLVPDS